MPLPACCTSHPGDRDDAGREPCREPRICPRQPLQGRRNIPVDRPPSTRITEPSAMAMRPPSPSATASNVMELLCMLRVTLTQSGPAGLLHNACTVRALRLHRHERRASRIMMRLGQTRWGSPPVGMEIVRMPVVCVEQPGRLRASQDQKYPQDGSHAPIRRSCASWTACHWHAP